MTEAKDDLPINNQNSTGNGEPTVIDPTLDTDKKTLRAVEEIRGCGYRKVNALYLVGQGFDSEPCGILPYELHVCPVCSGGLKFTRGFSWVTPSDYFDFECLKSDKCELECPFKSDRAGLMWVGEKFYTPESFVQESIAMGVSKRIRTVPRDFKVGEDWIILAHKRGLVEPQQEGQECIDCDHFDDKRRCPMKKNSDNKSTLQPLPETDKRTKDCYIRTHDAVFYAFKPEKVEMLIWRSKNEVMGERDRKSYERRGIDLIVVPDEATAHAPGGK